jgi:hypothetical protein
MKIQTISEMIATRSLQLGEGQESSEVLVLIGKPQKLPDHSDFYCPYQVKGAGDEKIRYACGIDPLQALLLALSKLQVDLEVLNKDLGGKLRWEFDDNHGFGLPPLPPAAM